MIAKFIREYRSVYISYMLLSSSYILMFLLYRLPLDFLYRTLLLSVILLLLLTVALYVKFYNRMLALRHYVHEEAIYLLNKPIDLAYLNLIEKEKQDTRVQLL